MAIRTIILFAATTMAGCAAMLPDKPAPVSEDGLILVANPNFDTLYVRPESDWSRYDSIYIAEPTIEFERGWRANQNIVDPFRITDRDEDRIKRILSEQIVKEFGESLTKNSTFLLVSRPTDTTLILEPEMVDLYISNPADSSPYQVTVLSESAVRMTVNIELTDSATGEALLRTSTRGKGRDYGDYRQQETVKNRADSNRLLRVWGESLRAVINRERGIG